MLDQSNLPPEWSYCKIWESHQQRKPSPHPEHPYDWDAIQNVIAWPEISKWQGGWPVLEIKLLWFVSLFNQDHGQHMTHAYPNHLSSQISTGWMHLEINAALHRLLSFPYCHFHTTVSWSFLSVFLHCASPVMTPSSPNTKPSPLQGRCCYASNPGSSDWSSVSGPRPEPGRRQTIWYKRNEAHSTRTGKLQNGFTAAFVFQIGRRHHLLARNLSLVLKFRNVSSPKNISESY